MTNQTPHSASHESSFRLIAPPHTPLKEDGSLNLSQVARQAEWLAHSGVHGAFVGGSTGEGLSLTVAERQALAEEWVNVNPSYGLKTIVHTGHNSQLEAIALAKHARQVGADAVAIMAPCYYRPQTVDQLLDFIEPVAAAAQELPLYFYEIPDMTGVRLPMVELLRRGRRRMPNLTGIKYTNSDLIQLQECLQLNEGAFDILFGIDEALLAGYALGARGAIGSTYNFMAPLYLQMIDDARQGDWAAARAKQMQAVTLCRLLHRYSFVSACKCLMQMLGIDCGPVRSPLSNLTADEQKALVRELEGFDVFSTRLDYSRLTI